MQLKYSLYFGLGFSLILGVTSYGLLKNRETAREKALYAKQTEIMQSLKIAEGLLNRSHPVRALDILKAEEGMISEFPALQEQWLGLVARAVQNLGSDALLHSLYASQPDLVSNNEELSIRIAADALYNRNTVLYDNLMQSWKEQALHPSSWLLLKADELAMTGEAENSLALLSSQTLPGNTEIARLLRLALLNENEHPKVSWKFLSQALKLKPRSGELHYYRGKLLQNNHLPDLASIELKRAIINEPEDPFFKEEYIKFCQDNTQYAEAYEIAQKSLEEHTNEGIWLSALFLHKVYKPFPVVFADMEVPQGPLTPALRYLMVLPEKEMWSPSLLYSQPAVAELIQKLPETLWLKVIGYLHSGLEIKAFKILSSNPEMARLHPSLYNALLTAISHKHHHLELQTHLFTEFKEKESTHPFLKQILKPPYSVENERLLASEEAYSAILLAAGWYEAALYLHALPQIPSNFPRWVAYGTAQALALNQSKEDALYFAKQQPPTAQLNLAIAEWELKGRNPHSAENYLTPIAGQTTEVGIQAASLLAAFYIETKQYDQAASTIASNAAFAASITGKEKLAVIAIKQGKSDTADEIYTSIADESAVAKSYLAAKAYKAHDYNKALQLTQQLLIEFPHQNDLQNQKMVILQAIRLGKS